MRPPAHVELSRRQFLSLSACIAGAGITCAEDVLPPLPTIDDELQRRLAAVPLRMMFDGETAGELAAWQTQFATKLRELIGPHRPPARWTAKSLANTTLPDHAREEWLLEAEGGPSLPLYVLRPKAPASEKLPLIIAIHGHGFFGHDSVVGLDNTPERVEEIRKGQLRLRQATCARRLSRRGAVHDTVRPPHWQKGAGEGGRL